MAADSIRDGSGLKKAALGAAGVVALRLGLRYALSGPLGVILTGAAAMSLGGYLLKNRKEITEQGRHLQDADRRARAPSSRRPRAATAPAATTARAAT